MDEGDVGVIAGVIDCVLNLIVTILPIPMVMRLQMDSRQRWAINALYILGLVIIMAGVTR